MTRIMLPNGDIVDTDTQTVIEQTAINEYTSQALPIPAPVDEPSDEDESDEDEAFSDEDEASEATCYDCSLETSDVGRSLLLALETNSESIDDIYQTTALRGQDDESEYASIIARLLSINETTGRPVNTEFRRGLVMVWTLEYVYIYDRGAWLHAELDRPQDYELRS